MSRAVAPVLGAVLMVAVTVTLATAVGAVAFAGPAGSAPSSPVVLTASANATADRLTIVHESGQAIDVRTLRIRIAVDGTALVHQPPVPFFSTDGFRPGPTGPFNSGANPQWTAGEVASLRLGRSNAPSFDPGSTITVRVYRDERLLAKLIVIAS